MTVHTICTSWGESKMDAIANGFYKVSEWITRFAYVNLLWIAFTIFGVGVLGLFPATAAMFAVVRKWVQGDHDIKIFPLFWKTFKKEFKNANIIGYIFAITGYLLSIEFQILRNHGGLPYVIASYGVIALFIFYFIAALYVFPIFVHFNLSIKDYLKWPLIIGIMYPIMTIFFVVVLVGAYAITIRTVPVLLFIFGGSFTAFVLTWGASKTFDRFEKKTS